VRAWGWNGEGELGNGATANSTTPVLVREVIGAVSISAGWYHNLAVMGGGGLWAWGWNGMGQLGTGSTADQHIPVAGAWITVVQASAGAAHSLVVDNTGHLMAWGWNATGQLGDGSTADRTTPETIAGNVKSVSAGVFDSLAVARG